MRTSEVPELNMLSIWIIHFDKLGKVDAPSEDFVIQTNVNVLEY